MQTIWGRPTRDEIPSEALERYDHGIECHGDDLLLSAARHKHVHELNDQAIQRLRDGADDTPNNYFLSRALGNIMLVAHEHPEGEY